MKRKGYSLLMGAVTGRMCVKRGTAFIFTTVLLIVALQASAADVVVNGTISGNGSGLTDITPGNISAGVANISISGNAATATTAASVSNGIYTNGSYVDPAWITALSGGKITSSSVAADKMAFLGYDGKVAIVAKNGGHYTDPAIAMSDYRTWCRAIYDPATTPCLLKIMPGTYTVTQPVVMQPYIDIEGSGENITKITSALSGSASFIDTSTVKGANNAGLRFVTVENTGTGTNTVAIWNDTASPSMIFVTVTATGGTYNYGVYNQFSSSPTMRNITITASGGTSSYGVINYYLCSPTMTNLTVTAKQGAGNVGISNYQSGIVTINHSVIIASSTTISNGLGVTVRVGNTQLDGGAAQSDGTVACVGLYDGNYAKITDIGLTPCQ